MTDFTRLTVIGTARKAELVIPEDEAVAELLPRLMDLLGEPAGSVDRPLSLVRTTGEQLDVSLTAHDHDLVDGELLRLVRTDEAPPPPEVADVTDVLGDTFSERSGRWSAETRQLAGAVALGALSSAVVALISVSGSAQLVGLTGVVLAAVALGRRRKRWGAVALTAVALGACLPISWQRAGDPAGAGPQGYGLALALLVGLSWVVLGVGWGIGLGHRPARWGGLVGVVLAALPLVLGHLGLGERGAVAVTAAVAVIVCGLLPRYALTASGLTGLDDQVVDGRLRRRDDVVHRVDEAYRALTWATFAVAVPLAVTAAWLLASPNPWAIGLGVLVVIVTALRTRSFPLAAEQLPLWLAVLVATLAGVVGQPRWSSTEAAGLLTAAATSVVMLVVAQPAAAARAFWRRAGNLIEAVAMVALIPVLLGLFGVYPDLLGAFQR